MNPDETTFEYLKGRKYCPKDSDFDQAVERWKNFASDADCQYDDIVTIDANEIQPTVTWGITPGQGIGINECIPTIESGETQSARASIAEALEHMSFEGGSELKGKKIDVAFWDLVQTDDYQISRKLHITLRVKKWLKV